MPRPKAYPESDALLSATEACGLVHVSRSRWDAYARRYPAPVPDPVIRWGVTIIGMDPDGTAIIDGPEPEREPGELVLTWDSRPLRTRPRGPHDPAPAPIYPAGAVPVREA